MVKIILIFSVFLFFQSCGRADLITPRQDLKTNLKLNGYYVHKFTDQVSGVARSNAIFLYRNGGFLNTFSQSTWSDVILQTFLKESFVNKVNLNRKDITYWGVIQVSGSTITIELRNSSLGSRAERTFIEKGTIKNDSTFEMTVIYDRKGKKIETFKDVYQFKKFSPKPDSTNKYIK